VFELPQLWQVPRPTWPGWLLNDYPEQRDQTRGGSRSGLLPRPRPRWRAFRRQAEQIEQRRNQIGALPAQDRAAALATLMNGLRGQGLTPALVDEALATVAAAVHDEFGFHLHREQLFCASALLGGYLAEMATGEGKSVTAAATAIIAALAGAPVHVVTTNDYLVARDAEAMRGLFDRFDLRSAHVTPEQQDEERRAAYAAPICYVSNKQLVFDYLRDRQTLGHRPESLSSRVRALWQSAAAAPLLRGLCFAIVDEADGVLIDDALTPLILSQMSPVTGPELKQAMAAFSLAQRLVEHEDFAVDRRTRSVTISLAGEDRLGELASGLEGTIKNRRLRLELVRQALVAQNLFERDQDYLVRDGEVQLIDQSTGRVMPDRKLQHGLHQMVELKERCELSGQSDVLASLSFQNFFRRYSHLCGMTGTAAEAARELKQVYGLRVVPVPTHQPSRRIACPPTVASANDEQEQLVIERARTLQARGQPVLIGTRTLARSTALSEALSRAGIEHQLLNASQDEQEAQIVAAAGQQGAVTIATNMAGRGTDVPLGAGVDALGGLHVIVAELNDNGRVDRQLIGRCARQGDPGTYEYLLSRDDGLLERAGSPLGRNIAGGAGPLPNRARHRTSLALARRVQSRQAAAQRIQRRQVAEQDEAMQRRLSFAGYKE
jgi:preprotein translocase subunit SecA